MPSASHGRQVRTLFLYYYNDMLFQRCLSFSPNCALLRYSYMTCTKSHSIKISSINYCLPETVCQDQCFTRETTPYVQNNIVSMSDQTWRDLRLGLNHRHDYQAFGLNARVFRFIYVISVQTLQTIMSAVGPSICRLFGFE